MSLTTQKERLMSTAIIPQYKIMPDAILVPVEYELQQARVKKMSQQIIEVEAEKLWIALPGIGDELWHKYVRGERFTLKMKNNGHGNVWNIVVEVIPRRAMIVAKIFIGKNRDDEIVCGIKNNKC